MKNNHKYMSFLCSAAFVVLPSYVSAQEVRDAAQDVGGGEIIVTAQRREQKLLSIPLSIQAVTGEKLESQGIKDLTSLQFTTPGYITQTNSGFTQIFMRGVGNTIFLGADPSVATFVDDVPRIYGSMADNLVDVERVEVLKGAQGGLYGRNATGGVVNIITRKPDTDAVKGNFLGSYGEKNTFRIAGFINLPVNDRIALSISGERASHDPYVKNLAVATPYSAANFPSGSFLGTSQETADFFNSAVDTPEVADQDFWAVRGKLLLKPLDNLTVTLAADFYDKDDNNGSGQVAVTPEITQAALGAYFGLLGIDADLLPGFVQGGDGKYTTRNGFPAKTLVREHGFSGTAVWETPDFDITSITAVRHQKTVLFADANITNVPSALIDLRFRKQFTYQELRAVSTFSGPWRLIFGGSYLENTVEGSQRIGLLHPSFNVGDGYVKDRIKNWSVYIEAGYDLTDRLSITASGRYMHEANRANFTKPVISSTKTVQKKFIPAVTLSYNLDNGTAYVRWARGFKTGGVNLATAPAYYPTPEDGSVFGPETVDTYEAGYKQSMLGGDLQLTGAVFYNDYKNLQVDTRARATYPQITTAIINAKSARTWGVEGTALWRVADPLTLGVTAGYLNAKYKDFKLSGSLALEDFDYSGLRMPKAPKWQLSFSGDLDQPLNDDLRLLGNVLVSHTSEVIYQHSPLAGYVPDAIGPAYWLVNARIGLRTTDDKYGVALVADNLFNEGYYVWGQSSLTGTAAGWGSPRIIRGEFTVKF